MLRKINDRTLRILRLVDCLYITSLMLTQSRGYPSGVPDLACESMFPVGHESPASSEPPPYDIVLPKSSYKPGETLQVTIQGKQGEHFTGLFVQARLVGCHVNETKTIGVFTCTSDLVETRHCFGRVHSAVSHTSGMKKNSISFYWTAPVVPAGHVAIRATIVKERRKFWTDIESIPLVDLHDSDTPYCVEHTHKKDFQFNHDEVTYEAKKHVSNLDSTSKCGLLNKLKFIYCIISLFVFMLTMYV